MIFQQNFKFGPKDEEQYQEARQLALEFVQQRGYPEEWVDQLVVQLVVPTGKNCCFSMLGGENQNSIACGLNSLHKM